MWGSFLSTFKIGDRYIWSIIWFRMQAALAVVAGVLVTIDPNALTALDPKYVTIYIVVNAFLSEWLRRRKARAEDTTG